jgi:uncharacterized membrane protein (UPF0136 family)
MDDLDNLFRCPSRRDVLGLVVGRAMRLTAVGAAVGLALAVAAGILLRSQIFGVSPLDPATFVTVVVLLTAVAFVAAVEIKFVPVVLAPMFWRRVRILDVAIASLFGLALAARSWSIRRGRRSGALPPATLSACTSSVTNGLMSLKFT